MSQISRYCVAHHPLKRGRLSVTDLRKISRDNTQDFVGRPGLEPGTLGLKGTFHRLFFVGLIAHFYCFQGIVLY